MTTIAVSGASGKLGHHIVASLLKRGVAPGDIVALARSTDKAADLAERGVEVRSADYDHADSLASALAGVDRLILVSSSEVGRRVAQHRAVIDAAEAAGVSRIVYTSILKADATSNPLAPEHLETEQALEQSTIPATVLRNSWYLENYTDQIPRYVATGSIVTATKNAKISAATREDYADAAAAAALQDSAGGVHELAGDTFTMSYLAELIAAIANTEVHHRPVTHDELVGGMVAEGMDQSAAGFWASIDASIARGDLHTDSTALRDLLGREPTSLEDAVRAALEAHASD